MFCYMYALSFANIISAIGMLKGKNWARMLFVVLVIVWFICNHFVRPMELMSFVWLLFFIGVVIYLYRPIVNEYFNQQGMKK